MSKLFKLKEWLTVPDAAKYLTSVFEEEVTEADVLRFALDGQLTLSVYLMNMAAAKRVEKRSIPEELKRMPGVTFMTNWLLSVQNDDVIYLDGVLDLPTVYRERMDIKEKYHLSLTGEALEPDNDEFTYVEADGQLYVLQQVHTTVPRSLVEEFLHVNDTEGVGAALRMSAENFYSDTKGFPKDSVLVVRTAVIQEFLGRALEPGKTAEMPAISLIDDAEREGNQVPEELDIALIAWRAACKNVKQGEKPRVFIRGWLAKNYPALSDEARKRIATVANWDKTPGAGKKSPGQ